MVVYVLKTINMSMAIDPILGNKPYINNSRNTKAVLVLELYSQ